MLKTLPAIALGLMLASVAFAHEAPIDEHTKLVPIPSYSHTYGKAGAKASLKAAQALLESFEPKMRSHLLFDLRAEERRKWSNLPAKFRPRPGLSVGEMSDKQRALLFEFLSASLGENGYKQVMNIMAAEAFLSTDRRAKSIGWVPEYYWVSFYGTPSMSQPWGWQYGGHHLGINLAIENGTVKSLSPSFVGTEPALFSYEGVDYRSVIDMHEAGYAVFQSLNDEQKAAAHAGRVPKDILTGPGEDGTIPPRIGLSVADMTPAQRKLLLAAIYQWVSIQPDEHAAPRMAEIEWQLDKTHFAWVGVAKVSTKSYMRIQGPTLIIELVSTGGNVGENAEGLGHYHTIYRNPSNEYGL